MLNSQERQLKRLLQLWIFLFSGACLAFVFAPNQVLNLLNQISLQLFPHWPLLAESSERFWLSLTTSLMVTLIALCLGAVKDISLKKELVFYILVSKITSSLTFILFLFLHQKSFSYLIGAGVDGSIFLVTLFFYKRGHLIK